MFSGSSLMLTLTGPTLGRVSHGLGGGARRWIKKATNVITLTWPMVDKNFFCEKQREKGLKWAKKG